MLNMFNFTLFGTPGPAEISIIFLIVSIFLGIFLLPLIFYLITLQKTLSEIRPENRLMPPANVWLSLIPIFGLAWQFVIVSNLTASLKAEFNSRGVKYNPENLGYGIGIAYSVLFCTSIIPFLGIGASIAGLVCWIIYWVKISNCKLQLAESHKS